MNAHLHRYLFPILLLSLLACRKNSGPNQDMPSEAFAYLDAEAKALALSNPIHLSNVGDVLQDHQFVFTGESHGVAFNYELEFMMLQFLVDEEWLDYYVPELPYSFCYFLRQYLDNGDDTILDRLFAPLEGTFTWTADAKQHWQKVRSFYQSLPTEKRFSVLGIEIEHQARNAAWMMQDLLPTKSAPTFLAEHLATLNQQVLMNNDNYVELYNLAISLKDLLISRSAEMKEYLDDNFQAFQIVNQLVIDTHEARFDDAFSTKREALIYQNFIRDKDLFANGNSYGQWGANHIYQRDIQGVSWLAERLDKEENSPIQNGVYSILYLYHDCQTLLKNPYRKVDYTNLNYAADFQKLSEQEFTLFRLDRPSSPFMEQLIWPSTNLKLSAGVTTDYIQALLLVQDSPAASPLN
ncbi:MAG: hypothetical protein HRU41_14410 [Saprospiraceae bacterium]|nr:hypothetical protein [Saprospiraceae bacterium]